jgi:prolyl oligopeptidase
MQLTPSLQKPTIDVLHSVSVADPYRWLENRALVETSTWIEEQRKRHDAYFTALSDCESLQSQVSDYLDAEWRDQPVRSENRLFYRRHKQGQEQASICVKDLPDSEERVLVDPTAHGTFASVNIQCISRDGSLLAHDLRCNGSDASEVHVVETLNGCTFADHLPNGYLHGFAFANDNRGFYYCHENTAATADHEIRFHRFGSALRDDITVFRIRRTAQSHLTIVADDSYLLGIHARDDNDGVRIDLYLASHEQPLVWTLIAANKPYPYVPYLHDRRIFVRTDEDAPNGKLIEIFQDASSPKSLVPQSDSLIQEVLFLKDSVYVSYLRNRRTILDEWKLDGRHAGAIPLLVDAPITLLSSPKSTSSFFYSFETLVRPPRIFEYTHGSNAHQPFDGPPISDPLSKYRTRDVVYESSDGTVIPMLLVARKDINLSRPNPAFLTSYGGFGVSATPKFVAMIAVLLDLGVIVAIPSIRGGSEFGRKWHEAARGRNRQTAFRDFIAAAEWLHSHSLTQPDKLAIYGASNAGLMVGAVMTQRPELFRAVVCIGPLLDMVRYEQFDSAGKWKKEYGSVANADDFVALLRYSPYHHVTDSINYPSTLFVSGDSDDRCNPAHVRKMAALLQNREAQTNPILVDYSTERGHRPGLPLSTRIQGIARRIAFLARELGIHVPHGGVNEAPCH